MLFGCVLSVKSTAPNRVCDCDCDCDCSSYSRRRGLLCYYSSIVEVTWFFLRCLRDSERLLTTLTICRSQPSSAIDLLGLLFFNGLLSAGGNTWTARRSGLAKLELGKLDLPTRPGLELPP